MSRNSFVWAAKHHARAAVEHLFDVAGDASSANHDGAAAAAGAALGCVLTLVTLFARQGHVPIDAERLAERMRAAADVLCPPAREREVSRHAAE